MVKRLFALLATVGLLHYGLRADHGEGDTLTADMDCPLIFPVDLPEEMPRIMQRIPAEDIYCLWQESDVNPYYGLASDLPDTLTLLLVDTLECGFRMPVGGMVTSNFGPRRYRLHKGTDIDLETGDTVICAFDGVVRVAEYSGGYGNVVVVRHYNGLETIYAHLSEMEVEPGTPVEAGSVIGLGGRTGHATGSHLHFEVRYLGLAIDSRHFVDYETGTLKSRELRLSRSDFAH